MALVRNGLSMKMKGRAGSFSFYSSKGRQVVRVAQNSTNYGESARRSEAQQVRRVKWANLVNVYKLMAGTLHGAFETKRSNETDYNAFMRKNLPLATVALTKDEASTGCAVPQQFIMSEGSLAPISVNYTTGESENGWHFGINVSGAEGIDDMTVKAFSQIVIAHNSWAKVGVQITLLTLLPVYTDSGIRTQFKRHELTLDLDDTRTVGEVLGLSDWSVSNAGFLYNDALTGDAYTTVLISDSTSGQLKVSTSKLALGDDGAEESYSSDAQVAKAIQSYGLDASRFLDSGDL